MNVRQVIPRDAIPSVDDPEYVDEYPHDPGDEVLVVTSAGAARAYPIRYLNYHEIVNDVFDGRPLAVTWCPLCGSAVVYDRTVGDRTLEFGVSGKLADDDLVMYDRQTESEWKQSLGQAIAGPLEGSDLTVVPAALMPYERFAADNPDGDVLAGPGGRSEAAGDGQDPEPIEYEDDPYRDYFDSEGFGLGAHHGEGGREWTREDLAPKDVVLGVEHGADALGFPYDMVAAAGGVAQATIGGLPVVVFVTPDGIHAFEAGDRSFEPTDGSDRFAADGTTWDGATGRGADGRELERVPARRLFAFAWQDDHGSEAFWSA